MLTIELRRAVTPEECGSTSCALCGASFAVEGVYAWPANGTMAIDENHLAACPACVAYFGGRNPERFPTLEEYEEAANRYPEPMLASVEEMMRLEHEDPGEAYLLYAASDLT